VGAKYEETIYDLNIKLVETALFGEIRTEAREVIDDLSITTGHFLL
jgi:hypothetical protein